MGSHKAWKFYYGHWEEIDDIISFENASNKFERIKLAGYEIEKTITFGEWGSQFHIDIYVETLKAYYHDKHAKKPKYPYYVSISFIYQHKSIYVVDFPSLFLLFSQICPVLLLEQVGQLRSIIEAQTHEANQTIADEFVEEDDPE